MIINKVVVESFTCSSLTCIVLLTQSTIQFLQYVCEHQNNNHKENATKLNRLGFILHHI